MCPMEHKLLLGHSENSHFNHKTGYSNVSFILYKTQRHVSLWEKEPSCPAMLISSASLASQLLAGNTAAQKRALSRKLELI